ncbi:MAG: primosomal protein N' [Planctomycetota bacterium]
MEAGSGRGLFGQATGPPPETAADLSRLARVAVERSIDHGWAGAGDAEGLTYAVPADLELSVGDRVEVPLGRGATGAAGVVLELGGPELVGGLDPRRIRSIEKAVPGALPDELVELARWMARYYVCPIGLALATLVPAAVKKAVGRRAVEQVRPTGAEVDPAGLTPSARAALEVIGEIAEPDWPMDRRVLARRVGAVNAAPINRLVEAGALESVITERVRTNEDLFPVEHDTTPRPEPTAAQSRAIDGIVRTFGGFATHLLLGVTGSGKTEVYLRTIERVLEAGRTALVLVPEIALTPQTSRRFLGRFAGAGVAVLHSGLPASARHREWKRAATGEARVVVGARSAVFAPLPGLGLIVVDEEHDGSYKQDQLPRYHARDVAIKRAQLRGCPVVLGSATPSLESYANAARRRATVWRLGERVGGARLPEVKIVDLAKQPRPDDARGGETVAIGARLGECLRETLASGDQAMLLLNRRGFASCVACLRPSCGWTLGCESCDARMVVHRAGLRAGQRAPSGVLRCHHCLSEHLVPTVCALCGGPIGTLGVGTQRVETELRDRFGLELGRDFERVDSDTMHRAADYFDVLGRFDRGELKLLLGTQMIAKGLDVRGVRLVGVLSADTALFMPDFRASERTFQLVAQVAGRAGRGEKPGRVIVQTFNPEDPAIVLASRHDYEGFAREELRIRAESGLPPARRMVRIVCRDERRERAEERASAIATALVSTGHVEVSGPMACPIERIGGRFRVAVDAYADGAPAIQRAMAAPENWRAISSLFISATSSPA